MPQASNPSDWLVGPRPPEWWTGPCPRGVLHSLPQLNFEGITRQDLLAYFDNTWALTEVLFSALQGEEAFTKPPVHGLRHPLIFYYGHPAILYVNKLRVAGLLKAPLHAQFENLFEVGVDEMSWDDMSKNEMQWPAVREVTEYRRQVYQLVRNLILEHPLLDPQTNPISMKSPAWALVMGFEHERIHLETSSVLMREMPLQWLSRPEGWPGLPARSASPSDFPQEFLKFEKSRVQIGKPANISSFGWDNEYGRREIETPACEISRTLVSNEDFLEFVKDGGYRERRFWSADGWGWRSFRNSKAPIFWVPAGPGGLHDYRLRSTFELIDFQARWPVIVNFHEANAYCSWKTEKTGSANPYRLISEAEHHLLRSQVAPDAPWNHNLQFGSETDVDRFVSKGVSDVFGNVWQWCEDEFNPLPGFQTHPYYEDFSSPCFDGKHQMIMGGSFASTGDEAEPFARFHFRPHFFQHAGFRCARTTETTDRRSAHHLGDIHLGGSDYESTELLSQYLLLHFGTDQEVLSLGEGPTETLRFPQRCAQILTETAQRLQVPMNKALDLGCAVGGSAFALSASFKEVVGVDLSSSFIETARRLQNGEAVPFRRKDQGDLQTLLTARHPSDAHPERIRFLEGDACQLPPKLNGFDGVLVANLLCRLPDPAACLKSMSGPRGVVRPGGLLVLVSPYSWMDQHTPRDAWLGGQMANGSRWNSDDEIQRILSPDFHLVQQGNIPLLIREHERKYQYIVSRLLVWRRNPS